MCHVLLCDPIHMCECAMRSSALTGFARAVYHAQLHSMKDHQHNHSQDQHSLRYRQTSANG